MINIYNIAQNLNATEIKVVFRPQRRLSLDGWIGAHIRNMLLSKCSLVKVDESNTLLDRINQMPLQESHPLHDQLSGGFPKGYVIKIDDYCHNSDGEYSYIKFSFVLIGTLSKYSLYAVEAIKLLSYQGIKATSFDCRIESINNIYLRDYLVNNNDSKHLAIQLITPLALYKNEKLNHTTSHIAKMNGFPSLYQIVHSAAHRVAKMSMLYGDYSAYDLLHQAIEEVSVLATLPQLAGCNIQHTTIKTANRRDTQKRMIFSGYTGTLSFQGDVTQLRPLLEFCSAISLGNDTVYGMGCFEIE